MATTLTDEIVHYSCDGGLGLSFLFFIHFGGLIDLLAQAMFQHRSNGATEKQLLSHFFPLFNGFKAEDSIIPNSNLSVQSASPCFP
jgi:hypothetical protein